MLASQRSDSDTLTLCNRKWNLKLNQLWKKYWKIAGRECPVPFHDNLLFTSLSSVANSQSQGQYYMSICQVWSDWFISTRSLPQN